jgi:hypothetical protein
VDLCVGLGFDAGAREPRVKLYLQEERWGGGLLDSAEWADFTREHGFGGDLPGSLPSPGVLSLSLHADGRHHWKLYLGGPTAEAASAGAPEAARSLAVDMARSCPLQPAWHYLSLRVRPGAAPEFAMNRIIDHAHWGLHGGAGRRALIWTEALAFLARGPARDMAPSWRRASARPGLLVVPTALALEAGGADLYAGAWELSSSS